MKADNKSKANILIEADTLIGFYPVVRHRNILTQEYIDGYVSGTQRGFDNFADAQAAIDRMDIDDSDYEVCFYDGQRWCATRDGVTVCQRMIP